MGKLSNKTRLFFFFFTSLSLAQNHVPGRPPSLPAGMNDFMWQKNKNPLPCGLGPCSARRQDGRTGGARARVATTRGENWNSFFISFSSFVHLLRPWLAGWPMRSINCNNNNNNNKTLIRDRRQEKRKKEEVEKRLRTHIVSRIIESNTSVFITLGPHLDSRSSNKSLVSYVSPGAFSTNGPTSHRAEIAHFEDRSFPLKFVCPLP